MPSPFLRRNSLNFLAALSLAAPLSLALPACTQPSGAPMPPMVEVTVKIPPSAQDAQAMESALHGFLDGLAANDWKAASQFVTPRTRIAWEEATDKAKAASALEAIADFRRVALKHYSPDMKPSCSMGGSELNKLPDGSYVGKCGMSKTTTQDTTNSEGVHSTTTLTIRAEYYVTFAAGEDHVWRLDKIAVPEGIETMHDLSDQGIHAYEIQHSFLEKLFIKLVKSLVSDAG